MDLNCQQVFRKMTNGRNIPQHVDTLILGAGLTGLSTAYHLRENCLVVDAASEPGGTARTLTYKGFHFDYGCHVLNFKVPWTEKWITDELGVRLIKRQKNYKVLTHKIPRLFTRLNMDHQFLKRTNKFEDDIYFWYPENGGIGTIAKNLTAKIPNLELNLRLKSLNLAERTAYFENSTGISFDRLVNTIPLDELVKTIEPGFNDLSESASKLHCRQVSICGIMLHRADVGKGVHWIDFTNPEIPFYRISMPHNINQSNCPAECSSISIEFDGKTNNQLEMENKTKEILVRFGLINESEMKAETIWSHINNGYIACNNDQIDSRRTILSTLKKHNVICLGRYGRWDDSDMESALIQGREINRRLRNLNKFKSQIVLDPASQKNNIQRYFANRYPGRSPMLNVFFRRGEPERLNAVQRWIPYCEGLNILDVGCGDGVFLSKAIHGVANFLRIEDFVESEIMKARNVLANKTDDLEMVVADFRNSINKSRYDVVLAFGLLDYYRDWDILIKKLLDLTDDEGILIIDIPKSDNLHSFIRKIWLACNNVKYYRANKTELNRFIDKIQSKTEIIELSMHWMIRINKSNIK